MLTQQQDQRKRYFCQLHYFTGCRLSEALAVNDRNFDFQQHYVTIRPLKQGTRDGQSVERRRDNALPESCLFEIQRFYATVRGRQLHGR